MKVLIVDDHPIVVSGFKSLLESDGTIEVLEANDAASAQRLLADQPVDLCVLDVNLPGPSGFILARQILTANPDARILMFSMNDDPIFVAQAMNAGARGYVSKNDNPVHMLDAIRAIAAGGTAWPPGIDERLAHLGSSKQPSAAFSAREHEILHHLAKGKSLSEIADLVGVSYKTAALACSSLRAKLSARTQAELVAIAVERKLV